MSRTTAHFFLFALIVATVACDKVALLAPTGSTVTLSISSTSVAANGTAEVIAAVIESAGTPVHNGTEVTFQSSVGVVDPAVVRTEGGIARTTFRANGASGTARITAFSGGARAEDVEVLVGGAAASTVTVRTSPTSVSQNGNPVEVIATVRDISGNGLPGAQVVFTSDNGTLSASSAVTDANGEARVTLTTSRQTIVTASVADKSGTATINVVNNPTVTVTASPANPNVGIPTVFTITPGPTTSGNAIANVTFDYGDGSPIENLGAITSATTRQHIYSRTDQYTATAVITDVAGLRGQGSATVSVGRALPTATITASPTSASVGDPVTFSVSSTPGPNGPPVTRVRVAFSDGVVQDVGASGSVTRSFSTPGTHRVTATPIDQAGTEGTPAVASVIVRARAAIEMTLDANSAEVPPNPTFQCSPLLGYPKSCTVTRTAGIFFQPPQPARVAFQAGFSGLPPTNIVSYTWNLGDGTIRTTTNRNTDHSYSTAGTFVVSVTVTTADGGTGSQTLTLFVRDPGFADRKN